MKNDDVYYSQFGEDRILSGIFKDKKVGNCIDVGANDGVTGSNTFFFEKRGWNCILVEPDPDLCRIIRTAREKAIVYECAASSKKGTATFYVAEGAPGANGVSMISQKEDEAKKRIESYGFSYKQVRIETKTLDELLGGSSIKEGIDFISIDVEGHELEVLEGFNIKRWTPTILIVEDNSNFEDSSVSNFLKERGYVRFKRTGVNDWYANKKNKKLVNPYVENLLLLTILKTRTKSRLRKMRWVMWLYSRLKNRAT